MIKHLYLLSTINNHCYASTTVRYALLYLIVYHQYLLYTSNIPLITTVIPIIIPLITTINHWSLSIHRPGAQELGGRRDRSGGNQLTDQRCLTAVSHDSPGFSATIKHHKPSSISIDHP